MDQYKYGRITEINSYGHSSTMIIDGRDSDIIKLTYDITIKEDNDKTIVLKTNNIDGLKNNEKIHLMYDKNDNYISTVIEDPEKLCNELEENKKILNGRPSFLGTLKGYIKKLYLPTLLPTSIIISIIVLFYGEVYNLSNIVLGFIFYWFFFLSTLSIFLSMIEYPSLYFIYSALDSRNNYYESFIAKYKNKISKTKKYEEIKNEYIQTK